jgi:hypothetical protein
MYQGTATYDLLHFSEVLECSSKRELKRLATSLLALDDIADFIAP